MENVLNSTMRDDSNTRDNNSNGSTVIVE
jgi:hypothetical protein